MENAVKALMIAAGVLIGIMIVSLGISLYASLGQYVETAEEELNSKETQKFNEQFLKYINCETASGDIEFELTIQDIVTAANTAFENNRKYNLTGPDTNTYYVTITLDGMRLENTINTISAELLKNGLGQRYTCRRIDVEVNEFTGRINQVNFRKIN